MTTKKELLTAIEQASKNIAIWAIKQADGNPITAANNDENKKHYRATMDGFKDLFKTLYPSKEIFLPLPGLKHAIAAVESDFESMFQTVGYENPKGIVRLVYLTDEKPLPMTKAQFYKVETHLGKRFYCDNEDAANKRYLFELYKADPSQTVKPPYTLQ